MQSCRSFSLRWKRTASVLILFAFLGTITTFPAHTSDSGMQLKIDPLLLVTLLEARNITETLGYDLFPGFDFHKIAVLFYRPDVQEVLVNFPHKPDGFREFKGRSPLEGERIFFREGKTTFSIDAQNTATTIEGVPVLVVADTYSQMRSHIRNALLNRSKDWTKDWLKNWGFIGSPYAGIIMILHEAFHTYQAKMAPKKGTNETSVERYPILDPVNNACIEMEGRILYDALLARDEYPKLEKIKQFVAVRTYRQGRLEEALRDYENLGEYDEGTAVYVEYKFLSIGEKVSPVPEMYYQTGFYGYEGLSQRLEDKFYRMLAVTSMQKGSFGDRFGTMPVRYRQYDMGASQALLLDYIMPKWKEKIFQNGVHLSGLLAEAVDLSESESRAYLKVAKEVYDYGGIFKQKLEFKKEGERHIAGKRDSILKTDRTLVTVSYDEYGKLAGKTITAFGITVIDDQTAIYDLVPVSIFFDEGQNRKLQFKEIVPVLVDRGKKLVAFAIDTPVSRFEPRVADKIEQKEFVLACPMEINIEGNRVRIELKKQ